MDPSGRTGSGDRRDSRSNAGDSRRADGGRLDEPAREEPALAKTAARARAFSSARDAAGLAARERCEKRGSHAPQGAEGMFKTANAPSIHMCDARGIFLSALQIKRMVFHDKASYETVWYMCTRIRAAMNNDDFKELMGIVEIDE